MPQIDQAENGHWVEVPTPEEIERWKLELIKKSDPAFGEFLERERDAEPVRIDGNAGSG